MIMERIKLTPELKNTYNYSILNMKDFYVELQTQLLEKRTPYDQDCIKKIIQDVYLSKINTIERLINDATDYVYLSVKQKKLLKLFYNVN